EARRRGNSVYLPQRVLPMFPELISNGLASLQQGKVRYVKSALMEFTADGQRVSVRIANAAIRNARRFSYEQVSAILKTKTSLPQPLSPKRGEGRKRLAPIPPTAAETILPPLSSRFAGRGNGGEGGSVSSVENLLLRMRDLGMILRARRRKRGALELS